MIHISIHCGRVFKGSPCAVAAALLRSLHCPVIHEAGFQNLLLVLWCLYLNNLLHACAAESRKSQVGPLAWCPTVDSEQGSRATGWCICTCILW